MIHWLAHYLDGSIQDEIQGAKYLEIDRAQLVAFDVYLNNKLLIRFDLRRESKDFVFRCRSRLDTSGKMERFYLVGYVGHMIALSENGSMLYFGDWNDVFHPVELYPIERAGIHST